MSKIDWEKEKYKTRHTGWNARNMKVDHANRHKQKIIAAFSRMRKRKDAPSWLLEFLIESRETADLLSGYLERYRDDGPKYFKSELDKKFDQLEVKNATIQRRPYFSGQKKRAIHG